VSTSCLVLVFALLAVKLATAGLTAILWGIAILNVSCLLGGLALYWEDSHNTAAVKHKAPVGIPVTALSRGAALEPAPPMPDHRYPAQQQVRPFAAATAGLTSAHSTVSASAA